MYENMSPEQAAAELFARALSGMGVIDTAWRKPDTTVVCATTHGTGPHLMNQMHDFDADVHLICATEEVADAGNLPDTIDPDAHGDIYFNVTVHGIAEGWNGHGLPTHSSGRSGVTLRDDDEMLALARAAGLDLGE